MAARDTREQTRKQIAALEASIARAKASISKLEKSQKAASGATAKRSGAVRTTSKTAPAPKRQAKPSGPKPNQTRRSATAGAKTPAAAVGENAETVRQSGNSESDAQQTASVAAPQAVPPQLRADDLSKAPGKQHRRPPMNLKGVKHSQLYIAKAKTSRELQRHTRG
jgi:hypothetical protein